MNKDSHLLYEAYKTALSENHDTLDTELGHDPKEVAAYDQAKKDISFDNYPFWEAYHAVKEGGWSEEDFHQWCQTVWNDGAENAHSHGEDAEEGADVDDEDENSVDTDGSIQPGVV